MTICTCIREELDDLIIKVASQTVGGIVHSLVKVSRCHYTCSGYRMTIFLFQPKHFIGMDTHMAETLVILTNLYTI